MKKTSDEVSLITVGTLGRIVGRSPEWVREKSDLGLIPHTRDEHGNRLFDLAKAPDAALSIINKRS